jgi:hypothetical protein
MYTLVPRAVTVAKRERERETHSDAELDDTHCPLIDRLRGFIVVLEEYPTHCPLYVHHI